MFSFFWSNEYGLQREKGAGPLLSLTHCHTHFCREIFSGLSGVGGEGG